MLSSERGKISVTGSRKYRLVQAKISAIIRNKRLIKGSEREEKESLFINFVVLDFLDSGERPLISVDKKSSSKNNEENVQHQRI